MAWFRVEDSRLIPAKGFMEFYKNKWLIVRKEHKCHLCGIPIPKGTFCNYESGKFEGDFFSRYSHEECSKEWSRQNSEAEPGDCWGWFESQEDGDQKAWNKAITEKYATKG